MKWLGGRNKVMVKINLKVKIQVIKVMGIVLQLRKQQRRLRRTRMHRKQQGNLMRLVLRVVKKEEILKPKHLKTQ